MASAELPTLPYDAREPPEGVLPWKWLWRCAAVKTPFSRSLSCYTRPPFSTFFGSTRPYFNQKSQNFPSFPFKMPNFGKFSVLNPTNRSKFSSESFNLGQKSVLKAAFCRNNQFNKPPNFVPNHSTSPHFRPFGPHTHTQTKVVEYFPGGDSLKMNRFWHTNWVSSVMHPFHKTCAPVRLRLPVIQKSTKSLKTLLVSHAKTFERTKQT